MLQEIADLGFEWVELSHGIRISLVPGILQAVEEGWIKVSSLHNFCPLPAGVMTAAPNFFEPTSPDSRERQNWVRHTRSTIELAQRVGADRVVCHGGSAHFWLRNPANAIDRWHQKASSDQVLRDPRYQDDLHKHVHRIRRKAERAIPRLLGSLQAVLPQARQHGVRLGMENREGLLELPLDDEIAPLLRSLPTDEVGFWYDAGHARTKSQYGLLNEESLLRANQARLIGAHLKDIDTDGRESMAIGEGTVAWDLLAPYLRQCPVCVVELRPRLTREQAILSRERLEKILAPASDTAAK